MSTNTLTKVCKDCKLEFNIDPGDLLLYEKIGLKVPKKCFECRIKQHLAFSVFGKFRKTKSDLSGESLITVFQGKDGHPIYSSKEWWGDGWDPLIYGQDYDSSRSFFDQMKELQKKVPRPHQTGRNNTLCDWCEDIWNSKNCYLSRCIDDCENGSYLYRVIKTKDSYDLAVCFSMQDSYKCVYCFDSFNLNFSENSRDCINGYFLFDCRNCQDCFMCSNLRNKQYCIRNKQYTKEDYFKELNRINLGSRQVEKMLEEEFNSILKNEAVHRENFNTRTTNSVGNYLDNCDKCVNVFTWNDSQNCRNCLRGLYSKDCIDQTVSWHTEVSGNNAAVNGGYQIRNSLASVGKYSEYIDLCEDVEYCFGCVGLRKKQYCILNKQYTKEEYEKLKVKIITDMETRGEYGDFFPYSYSVCDFNLSTGMVYFPNVNKEEIMKIGGSWLDDDLSSSDGIRADALPDDIKDISEDVSKTALICTKTGFRFNISGEEYKFHKRKNFALPVHHFDFRMLQQAHRAAAWKSYPYKCFYCKRDIMAYYPPEWGYQKIACENCYKQNIA